MAVVLHAVSLGKAAADRPIPVKTAEAATQLIEWFASEQLRELSPVRDIGVFRWFQKLESFLQLVLIKRPRAETFNTSSRGERSNSNLS
jgi:hypothetical protein